MSSGLRTMQKRMLKRMGWHRQQKEVRHGPGGLPYLYKFKKGEGKLVSPDGTVTKLWRYPGIK